MNDDFDKQKSIIQNNEPTDTASKIYTARIFKFQFIICKISVVLPCRNKNNQTPHCPYFVFG